MRVVGIAADVKLWSLRQAPIPQAYLPLPWWFGNRPFPMTLVVRGASQGQQLAGALRSAVRSMDPALAVFHLASMKDIVAETMTEDTDQTFLLALFAGLALLLAAVGTYGVMSYLVTQRTSEIGIRMALGAGRGRVLWLVLHKGLLLAALGIMMGVAAALATSSLLRSALFGVRPTDLATLMAVSSTITIVTLAACVIPALRAMSVEPVVALRYE
jgi:putative ABC transport system permease protein